MRRWIPPGIDLEAFLDGFTKTNQLCRVVLVEGLLVNFDNCNCNGFFLEMEQVNIRVFKGVCVCERALTMDSLL